MRDIKLSRKRRYTFPFAQPLSNCRDFRIQQPNARMLITLNIAAFSAHVGVIIGGRSFKKMIKSDTAWIITTMTDHEITGIFSGH